MKTCPRCHLKQPFEKFSRNRAKVDGLASACKACFKRYNRTHYQTNKEYYKKKATRNKKKLADFIRTEKSIPCKDCGLEFPWYCMDFDHLGEKKFNLGHGLYHSRKSVLAEIAKCEVVCACCHRKRTYARMKKLP